MGVTVRAVLHLVYAQFWRRSATRLRVVLSAVVCGVLLGTVAYGPLASAASTNDFFVIAGSGGTASKPASTGTSSLSVGFDSPSGVAADSNGNLVIADTTNNEVDLVVRGDASAYDISGVATPKVGYTYVLAGGGSTVPTTTSSTGILGTVAQLNGPSSVAIDSFGNVLIADTHNDQIEILAESSTNPGYTLPGSESWSPGYLYVIAGGGSSSPSSGDLATAVVLNAPMAISMDPSGNVLIADTKNYKVEVIADSRSNPGYEIGSGNVWSKGDIFIIAGGGLGGSPGRSGESALQATLGLIEGIAVDPSGDVVISDYSHNSIDLLAIASSSNGWVASSNWSTGDIYSIVGGGSTIPSSSATSASGANLNAPSGVAVDAFGDLLIADSHNYLLEVLAGTSENPGYEVASNTSWIPGDVYSVAGTGSSTGGDSASSSGTVSTATNLVAPVGVAALPDGSVVCVDQGNDFIEQLLALPSAPQSISATAGDGSVSLNWNSPKTSGGDSISDYLVYIFSSGSSPIRTVDLATTATSATVSGLNNGTDYGFEVAAVNAIGTGGPSVKVAATPISMSGGTSPSGGSGGSGGSGVGSGVAPGNDVGSTVPAAVIPSAPSTAPNLTSPAASSPAPVTPPLHPSRSGGTGTSSASKAKPVLLVPLHDRLRGQKSLAIRLRCLHAACSGQVLVVDRHRVTRRERAGSITIIELSVVASAAFTQPANTVHRVRVPLTSFGRRLARRERGSVSVVVRFSARGAATVNRRYRFVLRGRSAAHRARV